MTLNGFLSPTYWSLFVEAVGSFLMPFLVLAGRRSLAMFGLITAGLVSLALTVGANLHMSSGVYLASFAFGASILWWQRAFARVVRSDRAAIALAIVCAAVLAGVRHLGPWAFERDYHAPLPAVAESLAAMLLVAVIATRPGPFTLLRWRLAAGLGDMSYSLYLLHFVAMVAIVKLTANWLSGLPDLAAACLLAALVLAASLPLAALSYRFVELPGIALGRRAIGLFRSRRAVAA